MHKVCSLVSDRRSESMYCGRPSVSPAVAGLLSSGMPGLYHWAQTAWPSMYKQHLCIQPSYPSLSSEYSISAFTFCAARVFRAPILDVPIAPTTLRASPGDLRLSCSTDTLSPVSIASDVIIWFTDIAAILHHRGLAGGGGGHGDQEQQKSKSRCTKPGPSMITQADQS